MKIVTVTILAALAAASIGAQTPPVPAIPPIPPIPQVQIDDAMRAAQDAIANIDLSEIDAQIAEADAQLQNLDLGAINAQLAETKAGIKVGIKGGIVGGIAGGVSKLGPLAFAPQQDLDRLRDAQDRQREAQDRIREQKERTQESEERMTEQYRDAISSIDDHRYERALDRLDRVISAKWSRADGGYYWKAYALNKLGKRDEALATLAELPKQFPQSRWINDANALKLEIQQASGQPPSPESLSDEDVKLLAINALLNSDPDRAVPLLEKVLNDPKNNLSIKSKALFVLAQSRNDKARDIVTAYAKNGSNPDLQVRAVTYLGTYRPKDNQNQQTLAEIYSSSNDVAVKRAALRGMMISRDIPHIFAAAKSESNPELRRDAIRQLGNLQAVNELSQLYATESNADLKIDILQSLHNARGGDKLIEVAKTEKDPVVRARAIQILGTMRNDQAAGALATLYTTETDKGVKAQILNALWMDGACKPLIDINRNEKDAALKAEGVRRLGMMKNCKEATDYLMELISK